MSPYAWLSMEIAQETNSLEEITEINPLEIAEMFGNVGGFWGESSEQYKSVILVIAWPSFEIVGSPFQAAFALPCC